MIFKFRPKNAEVIIVAESRTEAIAMLEPYTKVRWDWDCVEIVSDSNTDGGN